MSMDTKKKCPQLTHLIQRIRESPHGFKQQDAFRLVQALLVSRITYGTPFVNLTPREANKLDALIPKTYKAALGLPTYTYDHLIRLCLHNTHPTSIA